MAKRFTDSGKWVDPWFRKLEPKYKLFWIYILDNCDHAGIWKKDFELASFMVGHNFKEDDITRLFNGRILKVNHEKLFIKKFIDFQYGELNENVRPHLAVIQSLKANGVYELYLKGDQTVSIESPPPKKVVKIFITPTPEEVEAYGKTIGYPEINGEQFCAFYESKGWKVGNQPMKKWQSAVVTWKGRHKNDKPKKHNCPHCGSTDFDTKLMKCNACNKSAYAEPKVYRNPNNKPIKELIKESIGEK